MSSIDKIAALLAMAERTSNEHEADAFLRKAQQLATHASVDLAMARAATARQELREQPITKTIVIGEARRRANKHLIALFLGLAQSNDVKIDIAHNSTYVIAYGMPSDIEVTEVLFNSLATQMASSAEVWLRTGVWRDDFYSAVERDRRGRRVSYKKPHTVMSARATFCAAFAARISTRVREVRDEAIAERVAAEKAAGSRFGFGSGGRNAADESKALMSTAVVLRNKTEEVKNFYSSNSKARGSWSGYTGVGSGANGGKARSAGRSAADRAQIGERGKLGKTGELE